MEEDQTWKGHVGRIQTVFSDGALEQVLGGPPDPEKLSAFICGNPDMVEDLEQRFEQMGFRLHSRKEPGNLHVERYW